MTRTDPEVNAKARDLRLNANANAKAKAKAKDMPYCPRGASRPKTWSGGLQHCSIFSVISWSCRFVV